MQWSEATLRRDAGAEILARARDYVRRGAVRGVTRIGDALLTAEVEGSEIAPYTVTVRFTPTRITDADCSCPYSDSYDGWCKHIVAALLFALQEPERVETLPPFAQTVCGLGRRTPTRFSATSAGERSRPG